MAHRPPWHMLAFAAIVMATDPASGQTGILHKRLYAPAAAIPATPAAAMAKAVTTTASGPVGTAECVVAPTVCDFTPGAVEGFDPASSPPVAGVVVANPGFADTTGSVVLPPIDDSGIVHILPYPYVPGDGFRPVPLPISDIDVPVTAMPLASGPPAYGLQHSPHGLEVAQLATAAAAIGVPAAGPAGPPGQSVTQSFSQRAVGLRGDAVQAPAVQSSKPTPRPAADGASIRPQPVGQMTPPRRWRDRLRFSWTTDR